MARASITIAVHWFVKSTAMAWRIQSRRYLWLHGPPLMMSGFRHQIKNCLRAPRQFESVACVRVRPATCTQSQWS
ncbi:hypothetical protein SAICODRAFT_142982 [Saitoella complicata NRRL Y-17804]|uniref:uncharacterized protein n=1 Tax=Saitoella complicata (strain BCRC 22490 / CBS 7301 / JCM 7358 / NBRC 10748 / NRRL Y-17804) TaxID=698492 RepID=UPI0008678B92|nr:uncharacterized protein SAICODRAFT_142982 [Saitoella complicata NRRL Y-17804]ODQ51715.1 hypothetical protein SAICODRAFT_142982 [Saitoella complicata NRRL Y-17804]